LRKLLQERGNPFAILIAFSGKKMLAGIEYTEAGMNGFSDAETKDKFDEDQYRMLVVANKYLTGFDQPKLCTMYVDKKLQGVMCVQALSRLNRSAQKLNKRTEDLFVLDFFNESSEIKASFDPFYTSTSLNEATDVNVLHDLKAALDDSGIYEQAEVDELNEIYFKSLPATEFSGIINVAANRFNATLGLGEEEKADLKIKAKHFVKVYGQVAAIMEFENIRWEKLFWFLKFLIPKMVIKDKEKDALDGLLNSVDLSTYGLERVHLNEKIVLDPAESALEGVNSNPRSAHPDDEKAELEKIISDFNEKWFSNWNATPDDKRQLYYTFTERIQSHPDYESKYVNNPDSYTRDLAYKKIFDDVALSLRKLHLEFSKQLMDEHFKQDFRASTQRFLR
jgi:type I restriction enzyme R subunit